MLEKFTKYETTDLESLMAIGGEHIPTYIGRNGDIWDSETGRMVFFEAT